MPFRINIIFHSANVLLRVDAFCKKQSCTYLCVVDGNVLATAHRDANFRKWINSSLANICDGSSIAILAGLIHCRRYKTYTGPELFWDLLGSRKYRSYFLGGTETSLHRLRAQLVEIDPSISEMQFESLPFLSVGEFNYTDIAERVNSDKPDLIWVGLGAPKQELFIQHLIPFLHKGVAIGVGAVFDFYSGEPKSVRAPAWIQKMHLEWLYRSLREPRIAKRAVRYACLIPQIVVKEIIDYHFRKLRTL